MRTLTALVLVLTSSLALAQTGDMQSKMQRAKEAKAELEKKFSDADANGDGKLTRDEANGKMPRIYQSFDEIDTGKNGYVTLEQVQDFAKAKLKARRAQSSE